MAKKKSIKKGAQHQTTIGGTFISLFIMLAVVGIILIGIDAFFSIFGPYSRLVFAVVFVLFLVFSITFYFRMRK